MRICLINTNNTGSTGIICNSICEYLIKNGDQVLFLCKENKMLKAYSESCFSGVVDDCFNKIVSKINGTDGFVNKNNTKKALRYLKEFKPEIVHIHNIHSNFLDVSKIINFCYANGIKIIWTLHDCWLFTGRCAHYDFNGCYKWKVGCQKCGFKKEYPASFIFDYSKKLFNFKRDLLLNKNITFVVPSLWLKKQMKESFLQNENIIVIRNGVKAPRNVSKEIIDETKQKIGINEYEKVVFSAAYPWSKTKGLEYVLNVAHILKGYNIAFLVAGLANGKKIDSNVFFLPRITKKEDMDILYTLSDVFFDPTLQDTFPSVIIESLSCGTPVVAFETGGCPEMISNGTGLVIKKRDSVAAAQAILSMQKDSITIEQCKKQASLFTYQDMVSNYYDLFLQVINTPQESD